MNLKEFFIDEKITIPFKLFGKTHLFLILIIIISFIIIYHNRFKLTNLNIKTKKIITKLIALFLLLNMIILYISALYYHNFNFNTMLPFHLCYISNYFYIYTILFNKEKLFKYNYLLCFLGPIAAIIFFDVPSVLESFNFYSYVICHHIFLIGGILTFYLYPKHIYKKDLLKLFFILNIYFIFMIIYLKLIIVFQILYLSLY